MAHVIADRVLESSLTAGSGVFTLAGAVLGFRAFTAVCAVTDTVPYYIEAVDDVGRPTGEYEYGLGTYSAANQLTRTTVRGSSNGGLAVAFSAGLKLVGLGIPAPNSAATRQEWRNSLGLGAGGDYVAPIVNGGTGGNTAAAARTALGTNDAANITAGDLAVARIAAALNAAGSAPLFACRAWVNFNGTGTLAIRASGNVTSVTDNGPGDYTVNFATALQDTNFVMVPSMTYSGSYAVPGTAGQAVSIGAKTTSSQRVYTGNVLAAANAVWNPTDPVEVGLAFFR